MVDTVVSDSLVGADRTARLDMAGTDTLTVDANALFSVTANAQAVRFNGPTTGAVITNNGTIEAVGAQAEPRAIRFETSVGAALTATITNSSTGTIRSHDDAIQIQSGAVTSGSVVVSNSGLIDSISAGQAIDFAGATGTFITDISNSSTGTIRAAANDAIRIGSASALNIVANSGVIDGGAALASYSGGDGIQFEDGTLGSVTNSTVTGSISGDRHGINAGTGSTINVTNNAGPPSLAATARASDRTARPPSSTTARSPAPSPTAPART